MSSLGMSSFKSLGYLSDALCSDDDDYELLKDKISLMKEKSCKFAELFKIVTDFCANGGDKDLRCQKCGLMLLDTGVLININRFGSLIKLQRSAIVSNLYKLGYIRSNANSHTLKQILMNFPESAQLRSSIKGWIFFESKTSLSPSPSVDTVSSLGTRALSPEPASVEANNNLEEGIQQMKASSVEDLCSLFSDPFCIPPLFLFFPTTECCGVAQSA